MVGRTCTGFGALILSAFLLPAPAATATPLVVAQGSIAAPINVVQMEYSAAYGALVLRNSASAIAVVNAQNGSSSPIHLSNSNFTDLSLTPDQRYAYAADYGGTNIGYGTPAGTQYVHRYDIATGTWEIKTTPAVAYHVEAVDSDHLILAAIDQWITIHGSSGSSSQEIQAFRLTGDNFVEQEGSGTYGSAQGYGGSAVLSTDDRYFFYGSLEVDALDVTHNLRVLPERIIASTGSIAFAASGNYYDAATGALLGNLGFSTQAIGLNPSGADLWAYKASDSSLRHFLVTPEPSTFGLIVFGLIGLHVFPPVGSTRTRGRASRGSTSH